MFSFFKKKDKDPKAVDTKLVRQYLRMQRRFNRLYSSKHTKDFHRARDVFHQLQDTRASANHATVGALNQAAGLPFDFCNPE